MDRRVPIVLPTEKRVTAMLADTEADEVVGVQPTSSGGFRIYGRKVAVKPSWRHQPEYFPSPGAGGLSFAPARPRFVGRHVWQWPVPKEIT